MVEETLLLTWLQDCGRIVIRMNNQNGHEEWSIEFGQYRLRLEVELPAQRDGGLGRTVGALERPVVALGKLLDGLFAKHVPARKEHGRVLRSALIS